MEITKTSEEIVCLPTIQGSYTERLNSLDRAQPNIYVSFCFFYKNNGSEISYENMIKGLRIALAEYPEVAGTTEFQSTGDLLLHYDNHGVKVIRSNANFSLDDMQKSQFQMNILPEMQMFHIESTSGDQKDYLLEVQFINMTDNSLLLVASMNHCLSDADGMTRFLNAWGCANSSGAVGKYVNNTDRSLISGDGNKPSDMIDYGYVAIPKGNVPLKMPVLAENASYTFVIDLNKLDCLRKEISMDLQDGQFLSKNDVLSAVFWKALVKARLHKKFETSKCAMVVNSRKKLLLPESYFGNCAPNLCQKLNTRDILEMPLKELALKIRQHYPVMTKEFLVDILNWLDGQNSRFLPGAEVWNNDILISSLARYPFYDVDFGFGKPVHVAPPQNRYLPGIMWIFPSHDEKALMVEFCLEKTEMEKFLLDENLNNLIDRYY